MSSESTVERARKRVVEAYISGFKSAPDAVRHGNTIEARITDVYWGMKFHKEIAGEGRTVAITEQYPGKTVLKFLVMEIPDQNTALFVKGEITNTVKLHNEFYKDDLKVEQALVYEKPPAQFINIEYIPHTSRVHGV